MREKTDMPNNDRNDIDNIEGSHTSQIDSVRAQAHRQARSDLANALRTDADFDAFCLNYFPAVYHRLGRGMDRVEKENILIQLVNSAELSSALTALLAEARPQKIDTHVSFVENTHIRIKRLQFIALLILAYEAAKRIIVDLFSTIITIIKGTEAIKIAGIACAASVGVIGIYKTAPPTVTPQRLISHEKFQAPHRTGASYKAVPSARSSIEKPIKQQKRIWGPTIDESIVPKRITVDQISNYRGLITKLAYELCAKAGTCRMYSAECSSLNYLTDSCIYRFDAITFCKFANRDQYAGLELLAVYKSQYQINHPDIMEQFIAYRCRNPY